MCTALPEGYSSVPNTHVGGSQSPITPGDLLSPFGLCRYQHTHARARTQKHIHKFSTLSKIKNDERNTAVQLTINLIKLKPGMAAHTFNSNPGEAEARRSL